MTSARRIGTTLAGSGPLVLLLHSSLSSRTQWRSLVQHLCDRYRLLTIDLSGYGETPLETPDGEGFGLQTEVALVEDALARAAAPPARFHLLGHSYGGAVALRFAWAHPALLRSLTLIEPTAFHLLDRLDIGRQEVAALGQAVAADLRRGEPEAAVRRFIDYWNGAGAFAAMTAPQRQKLSQLMPKVLLDFRALLEESLTARDYRGLAVPTCLIGATQSTRAAHHVLAVLATTLAGECEFNWVAGPHMAPLTAPDLINPLVERFLQRIDASLSAAGGGDGEGAAGGDKEKAVEGDDHGLCTPVTVA